MAAASAACRSCGKLATPLRTPAPPFRHSTVKVRWGTDAAGPYSARSSTTSVPPSTMASEVPIFTIGPSSRTTIVTTLSGRGCAFATAAAKDAAEGSTRRSTVADEKQRDAEKNVAMPRAAAFSRSAMSFWSGRQRVVQ